MMICGEEKGGSDRIQWCTAGGKGRASTDFTFPRDGILPPQGTVVERDRKKCIYYSLYAWGSTILISVISLIMEFSPGIPDTFLKPGFGKKTCWFERTRPDHAGRGGKMRARTPSLEGRASQTHVLSHAIANPGALVCRPSKLIRSEFANYHAEDITTHNTALVRKNIYVARRDAVTRLPTNKEDVLKAIDGE
uniref:Uncharacterized protein n=1 Tax=Timema shepardi TaxID=629360 RepID=A0A7R9B4T0_TIMSH|nr:unnamed protein product [Timema shepardi]